MEGVSGAGNGNAGGTVSGSLADSDTEGCALTGVSGLAAGVGTEVGCVRELGLALGAGRGGLGCGRGGSVMTSGSGVRTGAGAIRGGGALRGGMTTPARSSAGPCGAGVGVVEDWGRENPPGCSCAASGTLPPSTDAARQQAQEKKVGRIIAR